MDLRKNAEYYFGGCPGCGTCNFINVNRNQYGTCDKHMTYWFVSFGFQTKIPSDIEDQEAIAFLEKCSEVHPIYYKTEIGLYQKQLKEKYA